MRKVYVLTDTDQMPWGKYKGQQMQDVPAFYLIWLYENNKCNWQLKCYIEDNLDTLKLEVKQGI